MGILMDVGRIVLDTSWAPPHLPSADPKSSRMSATEVPSTSNRSPSKDRDAAQNPTVGVRMTRAQRDTLAARAEAAGVSMGALLMGALADQDQAVAAARTQVFVDGADAQRAADTREREARDSEHRAALADLKRSHNAELAASAEAAQTAVDAAYQQGLAQADPALQAEVEIVRFELRRYAAAFDAYEDHRSNLVGLVNQVLASGDRLTDPVERTLYRRYRELAHKQLDNFDRILDLALRPIAGVEVNWLDRHEREVQARQWAAAARATRDAIEDRTQTTKLLGERLAAAVADGDKRARAELDPEIARLQAALDEALAKLADLNPVQEKLAKVTAELATIKQEMVAAGWAGREAYVQSVLDGLRKPLVDPVLIASPHQLADGVQATLPLDHAHETAYIAARAEPP